ncbi:MAG TPA: hypothetical protein ENN07_04905 [candidate division Zixibacteria bacterium]|nr:hypothetical protein [candidate division Zixibacteria bacterium]
MLFPCRKVLFILLAILAIAGGLFAESFGRNKVQYRATNWYFFGTRHFTIYFEEDFEDVARLAGDILEEAYSWVSRDLGHGVAEPVPVIIYPSPADFQQTNIITSIPGEGTGGFTEAFKTRVVLPFNGSYEDFRHVIIHEMAHGVVFDKLLGRGPINLLAANRIFEMPLWYAEGVSEWASICWDFESDMYLRDAVLNNYVRPLNNLGGFLSYKQGASVIAYIARRYGRRKVGEILGKGQVHISADAALKAAIGKDQKQLYEDWLETKKAEYFPEYGFRKRPKDIAANITDHKEDHSYFNVMPAFSPNGQFVAFISDARDYVDLYVVDVITGDRKRIAKGQRSGEAETFHPFRSRPGWSWDGEHLAFSRRHGANDELAIYETRNWKIHRALSWDGFREISSPAFMADDTAIVFSALIGDRTDIYIAGWRGLPPRPITDDIWDDRNPSVSPDGKLIAFSSDRPLAPDGEPVRRRYYCDNYEFGNYNIWIYDLAADSLYPLTTDGFGNDHPAFSPDGGRIAYTSERNGIRNIWVAELGDGAIHRPYTDLLSGAFNPSWDSDGRRMVFSAFFNGGFDIYHLENPSPMDSLVPTPFLAGYDTLCPREPDEEGAPVLPRYDGDLRRFRFLDGEQADKDLPPPDTTLSPYRPKFSFDLVSGAVGYDTYYGFMGQTYISFSDILGNHRITVAFDMFDDIENTTIFGHYSYLARRVNFGATAFHFKEYYWDNYDRIFSDRVFGGGVYAAYPFSQFDRIEATAEAMSVKREFLPIRSGTAWPEDISPFDVRLSLSAVRDNSLWGHTGPLAGSRLKLTLEAMPGFENSEMSYAAGRVDLRRYHHFGNGYSWAMRFAGGTARGENPPQYWLGGTSAWLNWRVSTDDIYSVRDIYYSRMLLPLRGHNYFAYSGQTYALANIEFRYPFLQYMKLGMPPIAIGGINGALFADIGAVAGEDLSEFRGIRNRRFEDIKMGVGVGARGWIWWFLVSYDVAWQYDFRDFSHKPYHHVSLGGEF